MQDVVMYTQYLLIIMIQFTLVKTLCVSYNNLGQLGLGDNINRNIPTRITNLPLIDNLGNPEEIIKYYKSARDAI